MALQTNDELLEQLRAIGWPDMDISRYYPQLLPEYGTSPYEAPSTLYDRLLTVGWTEERIRDEHPEILPESEGGIMETIGEPVYTLGDRAGEPVEALEPLVDPDVGIPTEPVGGGVIIHPVGLPGDWPDGEVPDAAADQTADLMVLGMIFL